MKRKFLVLASAAALWFGLAPVAHAIGADVRGPACADIVAGDGENTGTAVEFEISLAAPSCAPVTYTMYVVDDREDFTPIASSSVSGNGSTDIFFSVPIADDDSTVCVYTTTSIGKHVFDRAPDAVCASLTVGQGPPGQDYS